MPTLSAEATRAAATGGLSETTRTRLTGAGFTEASQRLEGLAKIQTEQGDRRTIQAMREAQQQPPIAQETVNRAVNTFTKETGIENIKNPLKDPTLPPENAKGVTQELADTLKDYTEKGLLGVMPPERQEALTAWVVNEASNWPAYKDLFDQVNTFDPTLAKYIQNEIATNILLNPNFRANFRGNFGKVLEQTMPDVLVQAELKLKGIQDQKAAATAERGATDAELTRIYNQIKAFDDGKISLARGSKYADLDTVNIDIAALEPTIASDRLVSEHKKTLLQTAITARGALPPGDPGIGAADAAVATAKAEYDTAYKTVQKYDQHVAQRDALNKEIKDFEGRRVEIQRRESELKTKIGQLDGQISTLTAQETAATTELGDASNKRKALEKQFQASLANVTAETVRQHLAQELEEAGRHEEALLQRKLKEAKDKPTEAVYNAIHGRWREIGTKKGRFLGIGSWRETTVYKDMSTDYRLLMTSGPRGLMEQVLKDYGNNPTNFGGDTTKQAAFQAEIPNMLNNSEFMKQQGQELALGLLKQRQLSGKRMETGDIRFMASTTWGKEIAQKLIEDDPQVEAIVQQAKQAGMISGEVTGKDLLKWLGEHKGQAGLLAIIIALLTGVIGGIPAAITLVSQSAVAQTALTTGAAGGAAYGAAYAAGKAA